MQKLYSLREAAKKVGVVKMTLYRWERLGKVQAPKRLVRSNKRLYTDADIKRLIKFRDATR